jgi:shikimate kinase
MGNVVLIGYRGTGKSSVAEAVAASLGFDTVHLDDEVVRRTGQPIPALVEAQGWEAFFDAESEVAALAGGRDKVVIDTGGGVIRRAANMAHLKRNGVVFWLVATPETIRARIGGDTNRPSLTGTKSFLEEVEDVLRQREPVYREYADYVVETEGRAVQDIAKDIVSKVVQGTAT